MAQNKLKIRVKLPIDRHFILASMGIAILHYWLASTCTALSFENGVSPIWPSVGLFLAAITKPIQVEEVLARVNTHLNLRNIQKQLCQEIADRTNAEKLLQQKNQELEGALLQVQQSQAQVVQSEKMSVLGNLVAGVAHEINNPIGFLNGSINNAKEHVQDLLAHLELYQQHYPDPAPQIQEHRADIDLEFTIEDLPKLLHSMQAASDRIKNISTSLRNFSRADTDRKITANLHNGIDSTLLILKYRLKANQNRPEIAIIKEYGKLHPIECFPGQLNQVFMNILANAIDMFDEMAQTMSFKEIQAKPQQINILTEIAAGEVKIYIRDNGKGMSEEVQAQIFKYLFTTKAVGKGTGLGLAIARQIVVEKHSGTIEVSSQLGQGTTFTIKLPIAA